MRGFANDFGKRKELRLQELYQSASCISVRGHKLESLVFLWKGLGMVHLVVFSPNLRWYQHTPALVKGPDDVLPNRPFRETEPDRDLVLLPDSTHRLRQFNKGGIYCCQRISTVMANCQEAWNPRSPNVSSLRNWSSLTVLLTNRRLISCSFSLLPNAGKASVVKPRDVCSVAS